MALKWDNKIDARKSIRIICDEMGLTVAEKNLICAVIQAESGFNQKAININTDKRKTVDYGICQYNSFWYIGAGKPIASPDEAITNPEKCVRVMINQFRAGRLIDWRAFSTGLYKQYL